MATTMLDITAQAVAVQGNHRKVQELTHVIVRHLPYFRRVALRRLGNVDDAEDAVQDALLSAWKHVDQFRGQAKMSTWLMAIVINSSRMKVRRRAPQLQIPFDETGREKEFQLAELPSNHWLSPEHVCRTRELAEKLAHATKQLSPILRRTFQLRDLDGLSIRETAHLLGVPGGTVKVRLARARARLKEMLNKSLREDVEISEYSRSQ